MAVRDVKERDRQKSAEDEEDEESVTGGPGGHGRYNSGLARPQAFTKQFNS